MASWCSLVWSLALPFLGFVNSMTLQGCPGGTGFYESMNTRKTFMCALYSHEKLLPKTAPGSQGAAPDGAPGLVALENGFWLQRSSIVEQFLLRLSWLLCLDMFCPTPQGGSRSRQCVAAPRAVPDLVVYSILF